MRGGIAGGGVGRSAVAGLAALCTVVVLLVSAASALAAPEAPEAREPKSVTGTSAVLHGELNPLAAGEAGTYDFTYQQSGSECAAGFTAPEPPGVAHGALKEAVSQEVTNLEPDRQYTFCLVAINEADELTSSPPFTFETPAVPPAVISESSAVVSLVEARVEGVVNPDNQITMCEVEYGPTASYGKKAACEQPVLEGFSEQAVGLSLSGLAANTTYHYRFMLQNVALETTDGPDRQFTTPALQNPAIVSETATATATGATLLAQVNPNYQTSSYAFEYSSKESGGELQAPITTVEGGEYLFADGGEQTASVATGAVLAPGSTYYYRVVATNGTPPAAEGAVASFTTPPTPLTTAPTAVTTTTATLEGHLAPLNPLVPAQYDFEYNVGPSCSGGSVTGTEEAGTGPGSEAAASVTVSELQPDSQYSVCLVSVNAFGSQQAPAVHFTTPAAPAKVDSESTPAVTPFEAQLEAQINPEGQATFYEFEYSTTETAGELTGTITTIKGSTPLAAGNGDETASVVTGTLTPGTTYYYRVVAANGTPPSAEGAVQSFETPDAEAPVIESESVSNVIPTGVTLEAQVNPSYEASTYTFQYAREESVLLENNGTSVPGGSISAGSITAASEHLATANVIGLQPDTTYYYRVIAKNTTGTATGLLKVAHFKTASTPSASTGAVQSIGTTAATISGTLDPDGLPTSYYIEYGGVDYGQKTTPVEVPAGIAPLNEMIQLSGLEPGVTYHYRLVAANNNGTTQISFGEDATFTTTATPPILNGVNVSSVFVNTASITGTLEAQGLPTHYELLVGSTPGLLQPRASGQTTSTIPLSMTLVSLSPATVYYYSLVAVNPDGTVESNGAFQTAPAPSSLLPTTLLPPIIPYTPISQIQAKEKAANKTTTTKPLTNAQKLTKALKQCRKDKNKTKRAACEKQAHKKYPTKAKKQAH